MTEETEQLGQLLVIQGERPSLQEDALMRLDVVARRVPSTLGTNRVYQCGLGDGREAFHKPHAGMRVDPAFSAPAWAFFGHASAIATGINECAAWRLARAMGAPWNTMVPPAVMRWLPPEGGTIIGGWGPLIRKGNGSSGREEPFKDPSVCKAAALFDALIGQQDRHVGNQRFDPATGVLTLIDHGFSFPGGRWHFNGSEFVAERHRQGARTLDEAELAVLRSLPDDPVWGELATILLPLQMKSIEWRRNRLVKTGKLLAAGPSGLAAR
jgi:hypothetical protein